MDKKKLRPPAYPQVELLSDVTEYKIKCRHCKELVDLEDKIDVDDVQPSNPVKYTHECTNVFKVIWDGNN